MAEPKITRRAAHDDGPENLPITRIVLHATCGGRGYPHESEVGVAANTAAYFAKKATQASAHYIVDVEDEQHCLPDNVIGWHAPPNKGSVGIEICAEASYTREQWLSDSVWPAVVKAADRVKELSARHGLPLVRLSPVDLLAGKHGYCAHIDVSEAWHESSHTDVGPGFPWDEWYKLLGADEPAPAPAPGQPVNARPVPAGRPPIIAWPLSAGEWFGNWRGGPKQHGGYYAVERAWVRNIQQWLIYRGCTPVSYNQWASSRWADGLWEAATDEAMAQFHRRFYPGQPFPSQCWEDDYRRLTAH